eukprot:PhM_4_TR4310/c0_g1_i1/m.16010/K03249/EIF3F; translation initiation factor 3 subunit F
MTSTHFSRVVVDPTVVMTVLDHHTRRGNKQTRVMGAIYGIVRNDAVEVRQTIPITHEEDLAAGTVVLGTQLWDTMAKHARKVQLAPLVGWYATGVEKTDTVIDQAFASRTTTGASLRLIVDGDLQFGGLRLRVLSGSDVTLMDTPTRVYKHIPFEVRPCNTVQATLLQDLLAATCPDRASAKAEPGKPQVVALRDELTRLMGFLDDVAAKKVQISAGAMVTIQQTLRDVPRLPADVAAGLRDSAVQDGAAIQYLSKVVTVQLQLVDRLLAMLQA